MRANFPLPLNDGQYIQEFDVSISKNKCRIGEGLEFPLVLPKHGKRPRYGGLLGTPEVWMIYPLSIAPQISKYFSNHNLRLDDFFLMLNSPINGTALAYVKEMR